MHIYVFIVNQNDSTRPNTDYTKIHYYLKQGGYYNFFRSFLQLLPIRGGKEVG